MNKTEFFAALNYLDSKDSKHWPHNVVPGSGFDGSAVLEDEETEFEPSEANWIGYQYNPPQYLTAIFPEPDDSPDVRNPPTWEEIEAAHNRSALNDEQVRVINEINYEAKDRISSIYIGRPDRLEEIIYRLNARATPEQDARRAHVVKVCKDLEAQVRDMTLAELIDFDAADDRHWHRSVKK